MTLIQLSLLRTQKCHISSPTPVSLLELDLDMLDLGKKDTEGNEEDIEAILQEAVKVFLPQVAVLLKRELQT